MVTVLTWHVFASDSGFASSLWGASCKLPAGASIHAFLKIGFGAALQGLDVSSKQVYLES